MNAVNHTAIGTLSHTKFFLTSINLVLPVADWLPLVCRLIGMRRCHCNMRVQVTCLCRLLEIPAEYWEQRTIVGSCCSRIFLGIGCKWKPKNKKFKLKILKSNTKLKLDRHLRHVQWPLYRFDAATLLVRPRMERRIVAEHR